MWAGQDFPLYLDAFSKVYQEAYFDAGGFQIVDELCLVRWMEAFDGFEFEDHFVLYDYVSHVISDKLGLVIDLDLFFLLVIEDDGFFFFGTPLKQQQKRFHGAGPG